MYIIYVHIGGWAAVLEGAVGGGAVYVYMHIHIHSYA